MSAGETSSEGASSPGFSWSQVVRKDNAGGPGAQAQPSASSEREGAGAEQTADLAVVQDKLAAASVTASVAEDRPTVAAAEANGNATGEAAKPASPEPEPEPKDRSSEPEPGAKPLGLKSAWVGGPRRGEGDAGEANVESPKAVKVLSTSSQSWPTLGDSKTEPQKRGLPEAEAAMAAPMGGQAPTRGKKGGRGDFGGRGGGQGGGRHQRGGGGRQNGYKGGHAGAQNGSFANGLPQGGRGYGRKGSGRGGRGGGQANGKGVHHAMNGGKGRQPPAGYYMPVFYAAPEVSPQMYMMPPPAAMVGAGPPSAATATNGVSAPAKDSILEAVRVQVEYYFSVQNLVKDMFLRAKMDDGGWIPISVIAAFNRVRSLAPNPAMIAAALEGSALVEVSQDQGRIRVRDAWQSWVLPEERRDPSTRRADQSPGTPGAPMGPARGATMAAMYPCTEVSDDLLGRLTLIARLSTGDQVKDSKALVMTNDVAAMVNNGIAVLESQLRSRGDPQDPSLPLVSNHFYPMAPMLAQQQPQGPKDRQQMPLVAPSDFGCHVGWMFAGAKDGGDADGNAAAHSEIADFGHPAHAFFKKNGYVQVSYRDFRDRCLEKRASHKSQQPGQQPAEMYTLYQFWGFFLRDVFNTSMYEDFKRCALEDHNGGQGSFGIACLFGLYHNRLLREFRPVLFKDFEKIVQQEYEKGNHQMMLEFNAFCMSTGLVKGEGGATGESGGASVSTTS